MRPKPSEQGWKERSGGCKIYWTNVTTTNGYVSHVNSPPQQLPYSLLTLVT